jgi:hypothetical protein
MSAGKRKVAVSNDICIVEKEKFVFEKGSFLILKD